DLLSGRLPSKIVLSGVKVTLRFDAEGRLLTELPPRPDSAAAPLDPLPEIEVTDSQVFLLGTQDRQLFFTQVRATLKANCGRHELKGHGTTERFGDWTARGWLDLAQKTFSVTFGSAGEIGVTQRLLDSLPFVPAAVWRNVQSEGITTVVATLAFDWAKPRRVIKVVLSPRNTRLHVPAIDLTTTNTSGRVEIHDGVVTLRDMQGDACGGRLETDAEFDFRSKGVRATLSRLDVNGVDVRALPGSWSVPPQLEGRLHASAVLQITTLDNKRLIS